MKKQIDSVMGEKKNKHRGFSNDAQALLLLRNEFAKKEENIQEFRSVNEAKANHTLKKEFRIIT